MILIRCVDSQHKVKTMHKFRALFGKTQCSVIGMIHLNALPGSPKYEGSISKIVDKALRETDIYVNSGIDGLLIENMNDVPYQQSNNITSETTAIMARICTEIRKKLDNCRIPIGVQILAAGNEQAMAVAKVCELDFIRVEGFVFAHIADEGFTNSVASTLLRYRKNIDAENVLVFTDIKKKHSSHAITSDVNLVETAKAAEFFLSDGIILTGAATACSASVQELQDLKTNISLPILVGSGVTENNLQDYLDADALIVGSHFKKDGYWKNDLDVDAINSLMNKMKSLR